MIIRERLPTDEVNILIDVQFDVAASLDDWRRVDGGKLNRENALAELLKLPAGLVSPAAIGALRISVSGIHLSQTVAKWRASLSAS